MNRTLQHTEPAYWRNDTSGELYPAVRRYMAEETLTIRDLALIQAYLQRWCEASVWNTQDLERLALSVLRTQVRKASTKDRIDACIRLAVEMGMNPL